MSSIQPSKGYPRTLSFTILECNVQVQCHDPESEALLVANYGAMQRYRDAADVRYIIGRQEKQRSSFFLTQEGQRPRTAVGTAELLFLLEEEVTLELQRLRRDLYFVHAALLEFAGQGVMLVGPSGSGKSTTTWALLHHGFRYLSDELAPIELATLNVHPYLHALCLKDSPPRLYPLPTETVYTAETLHVPTAYLPSKARHEPTPLAAVFFLQYCPNAPTPLLHPLSKAEAGARLFTQALNPLAHPGEGLDGAIHIVIRSACFQLLSADLPATCLAVKNVSKQVISSRRCHHMRSIGLASRLQAAK